MREMIFKLLEEIKEEYLKKYGENLISIVLFGSFARGLDTPVSDVDILIILEEVRNSYEIYTEFFSLLDKTSSYSEMKRRKIYPLISPIIKSKKSLIPRALPYLWSSEFKIIYDRNKFFERFIKELENFKKKCLVFHPKPIPHYVVIENGK
ncbi:nucleotidyltransferase domain-containing protein [bacterium]|nr:nucleotidyltransferase domain-containing protein [bacterium]